MRTLTLALLLGAVQGHGTLNRPPPRNNARAAQRDFHKFSGCARARASL